jgi:photosystem II stability/assembly factor-like uncharacterized protein
MKYPFLKILTFSIFISMLFGACLSPKNEVIDTNNPNKLTIKNYPNDQFLLRNANPDGSFDLNAYENGLSQARDRMNERNEEPGYDLEWTIQGPGNLGARVNTIAVHPSNEDIIYIGYSHGGVWRTTDGGQNWVSIFDDQLFPSISDIAIDPSNPARIYVGTGDLNIPHNAFIGDGIYVSNDSGDTWEHLGLTEQRIVSKIIIDSTNPSTIYAATMGIPMEMNQDRGLYKSIDGGQTWEQILFVSEQAGIIDMVMDPFDSQTIYASGWDRHRTNKLSIISGPGARIFKTTDGGQNWTVLEGGLPNLDVMGRTGLAISQQTQGLVYAMFVGSNSQLYGIYRSDDGGENWTEVPTDEDQNGLSTSSLGGFGWYFGKLRVHPEIDDLLYLLGVDLWKGEDEKWERATPPWWQYAVHADKHDLVFTPAGNILLGTDGGLYKTTDLGETWEDLEDIPTTQFYRVGYNPHNPDWYYGGAQDNGTTGGNLSGINDWPRIFGGDGFQPVFHPDNPEIFYVETQRGNISVTTNGGQSFNAGDQGIDGSDDRNWDMPYMMSYHNPDRLIAGTDRIYVSENAVSPIFSPVSQNLTEFDDTTTTRNHNISTLHESPLDENLIYAGTADGRVWRTDAVFDFQWIDISDGLIDRYVTDIKASPTHLDWVYVVQSGYKDNDFLPRVHLSKDRGQNWDDITGDLPDLAVNDIYVLPNHEDSVLFIANDGGIYGSINAGLEWHRVGTNMPIIPVYDLEWNIEKNEIFAATFARSIMSYPLDSLLFPSLPIDTTTSSKTIFHPKSALNIYPSPAKEFVTIQFSNNEFGKNSEVVILNALGQLMEKKKVNQYGKNNIEFDIKNWISGTYFVKIKTRHQIMSGSFIKIE